MTVRAMKSVNQRENKWWLKNLGSKTRGSIFFCARVLQTKIVAASPKTHCCCGTLDFPVSLQCPRKSISRNHVHTNSCVLRVTLLYLMERVTLHINTECESGETITVKTHNVCQSRRVLRTLATMVRHKIQYRPSLSKRQRHSNHGHHLFGVTFQLVVHEWQVSHQACLRYRRRMRIRLPTVHWVCEAIVQVG